MPSEDQVTGLLRNWAEGDQAALDQLTPLVYEELRRLARRLFASEKAGHTWQPTALVHEAFAKLVEADVSWESRAHFYALSARMMRRLLVNHARARNAGKRGGDAVRVTFVESSMTPAEEGTDLLALNEGLSRLAELDSRKAELVELQYFAGLTFQEMAAVTGLSSSTLDRELRFARAWLRDHLSKC